MSAENPNSFRFCEQCGKMLTETQVSCCSLSCAARKPRRPLTERFWRKVKKTEGCWLWVGAKDGNGYGVIWTDSAKTRASHVSWELHREPIPPGLCVLHNCPNGDNPACVNPAHLWLGTKGQNNTDRANKGRNRNQRGELNEMAILTEQQVIEIRQRYAAGGITQRKLAKEYGVCFQAINDILLRKNWRHLE